LKNIFSARLFCLSPTADQERRFADLLSVEPHKHWMCADSPAKKTADGEIKKIALSRFKEQHFFMSTSAPEPSGSRVSRKKGLVGRALNLALWLVFCGLAGTGLLLAWRLPPGSQGGRGLSVLGMDRHDWGLWHHWIGYAFMALILWHVLLHWRWLWQFACRRRSLALGVGLGAGLILGLGLLLLPVKKSGEQEQRQRERGSHRVGD
jgi:hypothetical protein